MPIIQEWYPLTQITSLPGTIRLHPRYASCNWYFERALVKYSKSSGSMTELYIYFKDMNTDDKWQPSKFDYWRKDSDDILDTNWTLVGTTVTQ